MITFVRQETIIRWVFYEYFENETKHYAKLWEEEHGTAQSCSLLNIFSRSFSFLFCFEKSKKESISKCKILYCFLCICLCKNDLDFHSTVCVWIYAASTNLILPLQSHLFSFIIPIGNFIMQKYSIIFHFIFEWINIFIHEALV